MIGGRAQLPHGACIFADTCPDSQSDFLSFNHSNYSIPQPVLKSTGFNKKGVNIMQTNELEVNLKFKLMPRKEKPYFKLSALKLGAPSRGGAETLYLVQDTEGEYLTTLKFQDRPIPAGVNGLTNEFLLEVVIDRLKGFQGGEFPCDHNQRALDKIEEALEILIDRHEEREKRNVQGKYEK